MKRFSEYLYEDTSQGVPKYVAVYYNKETQEKLRKWATDNGLDLTVSFGGEKQAAEAFQFHTTIFFTVSKHLMPNKVIKVPEQKVRVTGTTYLGKENNVPVLRVAAPSLLDLKDHFAVNYKMRDKFFKYIPHVSISYNKAKGVDFKQLKLPDFDLVYDEVHIEDAS